REPRETRKPGVPGGVGCQNSVTSDLQANQARIRHGHERAPMRRATLGDAPIDGSKRRGIRADHGRVAAINFRVARVETQATQPTRLTLNQTLRSVAR